MQHIQSVARISKKPASRCKGCGNQITCGKKMAAMSDQNAQRMPKGFLPQTSRVELGELK
jgi:hypothetical protein